MFLALPVKNAPILPLSGICLNCDVLTLICCIGEYNFVRGRALPYYNKGHTVG